MSYRADIEQAISLFNEGRRDAAIASLRPLVDDLSAQVAQADSPRELAVILNDGRRALAYFYRVVQDFDNAQRLYSQLYDEFVIRYGRDSRDAETRNVRDARDELRARTDDELFERMFHLDQTHATLSAYYGDPLEENAYEDGRSFARFAEDRYFVFTPNGGVDEVHIDESSFSILGARVNMTLEQIAQVFGFKYVIFRLEPDSDECCAVFQRGRYVIRAYAPSPEEPCAYMTIGRTADSADAADSTA